MKVVTFLSLLPIWLMVLFFTIPPYLIMKDIRWLIGAAVITLGLIIFGEYKYKRLITPFPKTAEDEKDHQEFLNLEKDVNEYLEKKKRNKKK